jgi:hypothetical protein
VIRDRSIGCRCRPDDARRAARKAIVDGSSGDAREARSSHAVLSARRARPTRIHRGVRRRVDRRLLPRGPKSYRDPDSETLATFVFASLSGLLAAGAVGAPDLSLLLYPLYFGLLNGAIATLIHRRRRVLHSATGTASATDPGIAQEVTLVK